MSSDRYTSLTGGHGFSEGGFTSGGVIPPPPVLFAYILQGLRIKEPSRTPSETWFAFVSLLPPFAAMYVVYNIIVRVTAEVKLFLVYKGKIIRAGMFRAARLAVRFLRIWSCRACEMKIPQTASDYVFGMTGALKGGVAAAQLRGQRRCCERVGGGGHSAAKG